MEKCGVEYVASDELSIKLTLTVAETGFMTQSSVFIIGFKDPYMIIIMTYRTLNIYLFICCLIQFKHPFEDCSRILEDDGELVDGHNGAIRTIV